MPSSLSWFRLHEIDEHVGREEAAREQGQRRHNDSSTMFPSWRLLPPMTIGLAGDRVDALRQHHAPLLRPLAEAQKLGDGIIGGALVAAGAGSPPMGLLDGLAGPGFRLSFGRSLPCSHSSGCARGLAK